MKFVEPDLNSIPRLAHSLEHVLRSPGVHLLRDPVSQKFNFDPYLQSIHQPHELDFRALPAFTPSSRDALLQSLARNLKCRFASSTSSITPLFAQLVNVVTRFRPLQLFSLSGQFAGMTHQSTRITTQPIAFHVRPNAIGYSIDACTLYADTVPNNLVLIDLGKSLEAMLTLKPDSFESLLLKSKHERDENGLTRPVPMHHDSYHYLKVGDMLLRAQLDCVDESLPGPNKTFDIKTRATAAVRRDCAHYRRHTGYRVSRLLGEYHSYEREYYDMARSAFLKYNLQVRIGRMNGVFVAYHNTQEIFGFEYLSQHDLDECLYGSTAHGDRLFDVVCQLSQQILTRLVADCEKRNADKPTVMRVLLSADRNNSVVHLFVEDVIGDVGWRDQMFHTPAKNSRLMTEYERRAEEKLRFEALRKTIQGPIAHYTLALNVLHNNISVTEPYDFKDGDSLDIDYGLVHLGDFSVDRVSSVYWETLRMCK